MVSTPATNILDHIIHLTPGESLDVPQSNFEKLGFNVIYGGKHADGISSNVLIVLQDGVYLELLIFNDPIPPPEHWWASRQPGWIDQASAGTAEHLSTLINDRLGGTPLFKPSTTGGRFTKSPDGETRELKWRIAQPDKDLAKGEIPFFTEDLTPREWRVPAIPKSNTVHANGAMGVAVVTYITPASKFHAFSAQLAAFYGVNPTTKPVDGKEVLQVWSLKVPFPLEVETKEGKKKLTTELHLREANSEDEEEMKRGTGIFEVTLWTSQDPGPTESLLVESQYGSIRFRSASIV